MKLLVGEETWKAHFRHYVVKGRFMTTVALHKGACACEEGRCERGFTGEARCSRKDVFCKAIGRRIALTRAAMHYAREIRRALWASYWTQVRKPKGSA